MNLLITFFLIIMNYNECQNFSVKNVEICQTPMKSSLKLCRRTRGKEETLAGLYQGQRSVHTVGGVGCSV